MLKLMFITPDPEVAKIAMDSSIDRVFIDMECIGKDIRQGGMDTVQSKHTFDDIKRVKAVMRPDRELLVRSNPIHSGTVQEINQIVECGADIVMLPYFQCAQQVQTFVDAVAGRAKCCILIESKGAIENLDEILAVEGVDEYYVGLNDLHLDYGMKFMFEPLANGMLDEICDKIRLTGKPFGFGGVARVGSGMISGERVIMEHYRIGSSCVIVSRSFCNTSVITDLDEVKSIFDSEVKRLRDFESTVVDMSADCKLFADNHIEVQSAVNKIVNG